MAVKRGGLGAKPQDLTKFGSFESLFYVTSASTMF